MKLEVDHDSQGVLAFRRGRDRGNVDYFSIITSRCPHACMGGEKKEKEKSTHPGFTEPMLIIEVALLGVL